MTREATMDTAVKIPISERINFRMLVFIGIITLLVGYPVYVFIQQQVSGGISNAGGGYSGLNLKAMGNFNFDGTNGTINDVPAQWRALDGKKVVLEGEIYAPNEASNNVHRFELVYSIAKCCFGGPPKVQERVFCIVPDGKTMAYEEGYSRVKGKLHVDVKRDGDVVTSVYTLDVESIEPT